MARTYREIAIEEMLRTVEEAMSGVIDWWGDLPPSMKEAIEQFHRGHTVQIFQSLESALEAAKSLGPDHYAVAPRASCIHNTNQPDYIGRATAVRG